MKYIVSGHSVLRLADGTDYPLNPGIYNSFPAEVKNHWAFRHYAKPLDDSEMENGGEGGDLTVRVALLEGEIITLKAQLEDKDAEIITLKAQLPAKEPEQATESAATEAETVNVKKPTSANK
ncbi:hypothetical protein [Serratia fonticola]